MRHYFIRLRFWLRRWLGIQADLIETREEFERLNERFRTRYDQLLIRLNSLDTAASSRLTALEAATMPEAVAQLRADIQIVQATRREIEALRHEISQRPAVIKTRTASEFRKQMEVINGQ